MKALNESDRNRKIVIMHRVVERLDQRINKLIAVRNKLQEMAESFHPRSTESDDLKNGVG